MPQIERGRGGLIWYGRALIDLILKVEKLQVDSGQSCRSVSQTFLVSCEISGLICFYRVVLGAMWLLGDGSINQVPKNYGTFEANIINEAH